MLKDPPKDTKIWRYLDLSKFIFMTIKKSLVFSRVDKFNDPFEGSYTKPSLQVRDIYHENITKDDSRKLSDIYKRFRAYTFVNCWHMNEFESEAMWNLYLKNNDGVAVLSTYESLLNTLRETNNETKILVGSVKYIDYDTDYMDDNNPLYAFYYKRKSFEHEHELRAAFTRIPTEEEEVSINLADNNDPNIDKITIDPTKDLDKTAEIISVNLNTLIKKIYIPPTADDWFKEVIESLVKKYELNTKVEQSKLNEDPIF